MKRWSADPLLRQAELRLASSVDDIALEWRATDVAIARELGVSPRSVIEWKKNGLSMVQCDRYATRLGLHPVAIWPDFDDLDDDEVEETERSVDDSSCVECGTGFVRRTANHRFCSPRCASRHRGREFARMKRATDPEWVERELARKREYNHECVKALNAYARKYYAENRERIRARDRKSARAIYDPEKRREKYLRNQERERAAKRRAA